MNESPDPKPTVDIPSVVADSLDAGLAAQDSDLAGIRDALALAGPY